MAMEFMKFSITCYFNGTEDDLLGDTESGGPSGTMHSIGSVADSVPDVSGGITVCTYISFECLPTEALFLASAASRYGR